MYAHLKLIFSIHPIVLCIPIEMLNSDIPMKNAAIFPVGKVSMKKYSIPAARAKTFAKIKAPLELVC